MAFETGLFWKLKFASCHSSYLLGTIHLKSCFFSDHKQVFSDAMDCCNSFAAEVNLDLMTHAGFTEYFHLNNHTSWKNLIRVNRWNKIKRLCEERFNLDLEAFANVYPMVLVNQLCLQLLNMSVEKTMDQNLWEMASVKNLQSTGLEDFDQHFSIIRKIDLPDQVKMLKDLLSNLDRSKRKYKKLIQDYQNQDLKTVYHASKKMLGKYRDLMLFNRNEIMMNKIWEMGNNEPAFFTCGAGHFYGSRGILRLLKKRGVKLQHVPL